MTKIYMAEGDFRHTECHGFGSTPVEAYAALLSRWRNDWSKYTESNPDLPERYREETRIYQIELGKGYVLGVTDHMARPIFATGDNSMFDGLFEPRNEPAANGPKI